MEPTDADLVARARAGDREAFEGLYARHKEFALSVAWRFLGDEHECLDVLQEAFLYVSRKLPGLELAGRFTTFLYPVVKHIALTKRRGRRATVPLAEEPAVHAQWPAEVKDVLEALQPLQREILQLRFLDGWGLQEIADLLGIPLGTVKSRLHNAIALLREKIG